MGLRRIIISILLFLFILFFGLYQAEKEINNMIGIDSPPRSINLVFQEEGRFIFTFADRDYVVSLSGIKRVGKS